MTEVLKEAFKAYPENRNLPGVDSNVDLRNAYIRNLKLTVDQAMKFTEIYCNIQKTK